MFGLGSTFVFHGGDNDPITDLDAALGAAFTLSITGEEGASCVIIDDSSVTLSTTVATNCDTPQLSFESSVPGERGTAYISIPSTLHRWWLEKLV